MVDGFEGFNENTGAGIGVGASFAPAVAVTRPSSRAIACTPTVSVNRSVFPSK